MLSTSHPLGGRGLWRDVRQSLTVAAWTPHDGHTTSRVARVWTKRATRAELVHVSLFRLNHGQPEVQAHPEIVQGTAELHHEIADALLPQADPVFHNATTLDAAVDMLDPQPPLVERLVRPLLLQGQLRTAWLLRRHEDL